MDFRVRRYKGDYDYSYTLGMAPTIELIKYKKEYIYKVYIHPDYEVGDDSINMYDICDKYGIEYVVNKNIFNRVSNKGNVYVLGVFYKYQSRLDEDQPHIILVNPSNAGNLGTILRTGLGFGFNNLAIITPAVDIYNPNTIRSSMGAIFSNKFQFFENIEDYRKLYGNHKFYSFIIGADNKLKEVKVPEDRRFSLVFGNEATGLPDEFEDMGESVFINHSDEIDSLNLAISFGIAANYFSEY